MCPFQLSHSHMSDRIVKTNQLTTQLLAYLFSIFIVEMFRGQAGLKTSDTRDRMELNSVHYSMCTSKKRWCIRM